MSRGPWGPNHPFFQAWGTALHGPEAPTGGGQLLGAPKKKKTKNKNKNKKTKAAPAAQAAPAATAAQ